MARLIQFKRHTDQRGSLVPVEGMRDVPFEIKRRWHIKGVPEGEIRGGHAHRNAQQVVMALNGSFGVSVAGAGDVASILLDSDDVGLYIEPGEFVTLSDFSGPDAVCEVLCDSYYDEEDYVLPPVLDSIQQPWGRPEPAAVQSHD